MAFLVLRSGVSAGRVVPRRRRHSALTPEFRRAQARALLDVEALAEAPNSVRPPRLVDEGPWLRVLWAGLTALCGWSLLTPLHPSPSNPTGAFQDRYVMERIEQYAALRNAVDSSPADRCQAAQQVARFYRAQGAGSSLRRWSAVSAQDCAKASQ